MNGHITKVVHLGSNNDQCYIQNSVVTDYVMKRSRCNMFQSTDLYYDIDTIQMQGTCVAFIFES